MVLQPGDTLAATRKMRDENGQEEDRACMNLSSEIGRKFSNSSVPSESCSSSNEAAAETSGRKALIPSAWITQSSRGAWFTSQGPTKKVETP